MILKSRWSIRPRSRFRAWACSGVLQPRPRRHRPDGSSPSDLRIRHALLHRRRFGSDRTENAIRSTHSTIPFVHLMVEPTTLTVRSDVLAGWLVELPEP